MTYKNGKDILPSRLLMELQEYIQGEIIYIPKRGKKRAGWGECNGTRRSIDRRNNEIYKSYQSGLNIDELISRYHLSEDSIRRIIAKTKSYAKR